MKFILKKATALLLCALLTVSLGVMLASCDGTGDGGGTVTVVVETAPVGSDDIKTTSYEVDLDGVTGVGVVGVLEYLKENEGLEFSMDGTMVSRVGNLTNDYANGVYIYLYTSVSQDMDVSVYAQQKEYNGKTLVSSGVGISEMSAPDGAIIYVGTIAYGS